MLKKQSEVGFATEGSPKKGETTAKKSKEKSKYDSLNLRYGDIIYLKFYVDSQNRGIISGDGIASNKLECIPISKIKKRFSSRISIIDNLGGEDELEDVCCNVRSE